MADMKRRDVLRYGAAGVVTTASALVGVQGLVTTGSAAARQAAPAADPRDFDEVYKGKKIKGKHNPRGKDELHINNKKLALTAISTLFVPEDGSEPHVGVGYISAINHYDPVKIDNAEHRDGLKRLAQKVVDILGDFELSDEASKGHTH